MEGLPRQGEHETQDDDTRHWRVHAALPAACAAHRLPSYPPLWVDRQWRAAREPGAGTRTAARRAGGVRSERCAERSGTTDLRLSALRCADAHHRDAAAHPADTRAASSAGTAMSIVSFYRPSKSCRRVPARRCFAWRASTDALTPVSDAGGCPNDNGIDDLIETLRSTTSPIDPAGRKRTHQIPIACTLI